MLPATGFFKDIDCPYYEKSCVRPYCHFRHRKRSQEPPSPTEVPTYKPTPKSELASTKSHIPISYVPDLVMGRERSSRIYNLSDRPTYKPTPISFLSAQNVSKVCEYKPISLSLDADAKAEEIDLADLSTEFDLIDEILEDDSRDSTKQFPKIEEETKCSDKNKKSSDKSKEEKSSDKKSSDKNKHREEENKYKNEEDRKHKHSRSKSENEVKDKDKEREKSRNRDKEKLRDYEKKEKEKDSKSRSEEEKSERYSKGHGAKLKNVDYESSDSESNDCEIENKNSDSSEDEKQRNKNKKRSSDSSDEHERGNKYKSKKTHERKRKEKPKESEREKSKNKHEVTKKCEDGNSDRENRDKHSRKEDYKNKRESSEKRKSNGDRNKDKNRDREDESSDKQRSKHHENKKHEDKSSDRDSKKKNRERDKSSERENKKKNHDRDDKNSKKKNYDFDDKSSKKKNYDSDDKSSKRKNYDSDDKSSRKKNYDSDDKGSKKKNYDSDDKSSKKKNYDSDDKSSKKKNYDSDDRSSKKKNYDSDDKNSKKKHYDSDDKNSDRDNKKKSYCEDKNSERGSKKKTHEREHSESKNKNKSSDREIKKRNRERDKSSERDSKRNKDRNKNKHDRDNSESKDKRKDYDKRAKNKSESEQLTTTTEQHNLSDSEQMDFEDEVNFELYGEDEEMGMDSVEAECYKIFNEYTPPVVEEKYEPVSIKSPETEPVPYNPTCKKRIAYEKAGESVSKFTYNKPKAIGNASLTMLNRLKLARQAQAGNDYKDLLAELKEQKMDLKRKVTDTGYSQNKRFADDDDDFNYSQKSNFSLSTKHNLSSSTSSSSKYNPHSVTPSSSYSKNNLKTVSKNPVSLVDEIISGRSASASANKIKRIAPVQNVGLIQRAKAQFDEMVKNKAAQVLKTQAQTLGKGNKRQAHIPDASLSDLPDVLNADRSKLPVNVRTRYLTMLADETIKLYVFKEDAYQRALNEELKCYEKCSVLGTYRNSAMLAINRLRKEIQERENAGLGPIQPGEVNGARGGSATQGKSLYDAIQSYILTEDELVLHGYPREGAEPGRALISMEMRGVVVNNLGDNQRVCCRCHKDYLVDDDGMPLEVEDCVYHPLRKRTLRGERTYLCCKSTDDTGCAISNTHVSEANPDRVLEGYQSTMEPESENDPRSSAVYALDCEMCYTTIGLELTRVTIVDTNLKTVYESLVKPLNPIIDYNTRFSGITEDQMERTSTSILQVQANILHLCNSKTILIGHSLESDMKALKIIHSNIIDTSVMFPHKFGLPHKRALRVLASEYLRKIIQNSTDGHDSAEDALACMELVLWKAKEDSKLKGTKG